MSTIRPFSAIHYAATRGSDISSRINPPYDILAEADKRDLLATDPRNFVRLDLPHVPPKAAGPPAAYDEARETLDEWLRDGTLVRDAKPALYAYHQVYAHDRHSYTRKKFFARLRLEQFGSGGVFPHELTFGGPKEDRLALTKATAANLSPIFALYEDKGNEIAARVEKSLPARPLLTGTMSGVENRLWAVEDERTIADVCQAMAGKPVYIADGHHRYGTSLLYRDWLREQRGELPADHPANFILCVFCAMEDPGLLILPTHRVLPRLRGAAELLKADPQLTVAPLPVGDGDEALAALVPLGRQAVALYEGAGKRYWSVRPRDADILAAHMPNRAPAWRKFGLSILHAYLIDRVLTPKAGPPATAEIAYVKSTREAQKVAEDSGGSALLVQPCTMEELRAVCSAGELMPQKSTYFYPKLASGLLINPLE